MRFYSTFGHLYLNTSVSYHLQFARVTRPDVLRHFWRQFWQHVLKRFWRVPFCGVPCLGFARSCWLVSAARCGVAEPTPSRKQSIRDRAAGAVANVLINPCNARISTCRWAHGKGHYDNRFVRKLQFGHCVANVARDPFRKNDKCNTCCACLCFPSYGCLVCFWSGFAGFALHWARSAVGADQPNAARRGARRAAKAAATNAARSAQTEQSYKIYHRSHFGSR